MAISDINIEICNLALSHIRGFPIQSLISPKTKEDKECKRLYIPAKNMTLEAFDWSFARKHKTLAVVSGFTRPGWTYVYEYPVDCLAPRYIYNSAKDSHHDPIAYEVGVSDDLTKRYIFSDQEDAILFYTAEVTDENLFTPGFKLSLSYRLASMLAVPIKSQPRLEDQMLQRFYQTLGSSESTNANSSHKDNSTKTSSYEDAR